MLKIALIGVGRWGTNIKRTLGEIDGVEVKAVDSPARSRSLRLDDIDGAVIATPGASHAKVAVPFIKQGLPTFIEKPLATTLKDAQKMDKLAKQSGAMIFVGHIHLYNPAYLKAKALTKNIGSVRALYLEGANNGPFRDDMSALWDWSPHDVSMAIDLLKGSPKTVQAWALKTLRPKTNLYDMVRLKLEFPKNITVLISNGWLSPRKVRRLEIVGGTSSIVVDDVAQKRKISVFEAMGPSARSRHIVQKDPKIVFPRYGTVSPLKAELSAFINCIKANTQPTTDIKHGLEVTRILDAAERSIQQNGRVIKT